MTNVTYTSMQLEATGVRCSFLSQGIEHDGWIMPDGFGVAFTGSIQKQFEPASIATGNSEALLLARRAVAEQAFIDQFQGQSIMECGEWFEEGAELLKYFTVMQFGKPCDMQVRVHFMSERAAWTNVSHFNITNSLTLDGWEPSYSKWRHGGWYVNNTYPSGGSGCVSNNYDDGKWRIVCDPRRGSLGQPGDFTFKTRDEAARAERVLIRDMALEMLAKRADRLKAA
ncbi:hypothetical protein [Stutzerimonas stutzeri]|nr:hypothetical protein [Stutzerimonas stutzeri]MBA1280465.1 hypothetical protein [Stutzerimonas stutzeri]